MKYVYTYIGTNYMHSNEKNWLKKSYKHKRASDLAEIFETGKVLCDVCTSYRNERKNLEKILNGKDNILIVYDLSSISNKSELFEIYKRIMSSGTEILICSFNSIGMLEAHPLSSVSLQFTKENVLSLEERMEMLKGIVSDVETTASVQHNVGEALISAYWDIELRNKTFTDAMKTLDISKNTYMTRIQSYIGSDAWCERYAQELNNPAFATRPAQALNRCTDGVVLYEYIANNPSAKVLSPCELAFRAGIVEEVPMEIAEMIASGNISVIRNTVKAYDAYRNMLKHTRAVKNKIANSKRKKSK